MNEQQITGLEGLDPRTKNRWESEIRAALLGTKKVGKAGPKACSVCGMPDTRNHKGLTGDHAKASLEAWPTQWRMLTRALEQKLDFATQQKFNAQQRFLMDKLLLARIEHEKYEPTTNTANAISNKSLVLGVLAATFKMLGIEIPICPKAKDGTTDRPWSVLQLTEILNLELAKLHGVDTDVTVSEHPAEGEPEADKQDGDKGEQSGEQQQPPAGVVVSGEEQQGSELRNGEQRDPAPSAAQTAKDALTTNGGTSLM